MTIAPIDPSHSTSQLLNLDEQVRCGIGGDSAAEIAALLLLGAQESQKISRTLRQAEEQSLTHFEQQQVDAMHAQADATRNAGFARGMGMVCAGGLSVFGVGSEEPNTVGASAELAKGSGELLGALSDGIAGHAGANATHAGNVAKQAERALRDLDQLDSEASELQRTALQAAKDLIQIQAQTDQATLYLRG
jgi:hypothetical protein